MHTRTKEEKYWFFFLTQERGGLGGSATEKLVDIGPNAVKGGNEALGKGEPVDPRVLLVCEDAEQAPRDDNSAEDVTLLLLKLDVADSGGAQEDDSQDGENDVKGVGAVFLDGCEGGKKSEGSLVHDPTVPEAEGRVHKELGVPEVGGVVGLKVVEDKRNRGRREEDSNQSEDEVTLFPENNPGSIEKGGNDKVPANTENNIVLCALKPLSNNEATQKNVNQRPRIVNPLGGSDISLVRFERVLIGAGTGNRPDSGRQEEQVNENIGNLENQVQVGHDGSFF